MELRGGLQQQQLLSPDDSEGAPVEVSLQQQMPTIDSARAAMQQQQHDLAAMGSMMVLNCKDSSHDQNQLHHHQHHILMNSPYATIVTSDEQHHTAGSSYYMTNMQQQVKQEAADAAAESAQHMLLIPSIFSTMDHHQQVYWGGVQDHTDLMESMSPDSADLCRNLSSQLEHFRKELALSSNINAVEDQQQRNTLRTTAENSSSGVTSDLVGSNSVAAAAAAAAHEQQSLSGNNTEMLKAAIASHPHYPQLVAAHMNCHKVGAPAEVVSQIDEIIQSVQEFQPAVSTSIGANPDLDQFMGSYYTMLVKYEKEIKKTYKDAVAFCKKLEQQFQVITGGGSVAMSSVVSGESEERNDGYESSEEDDSGGELEIEVDPMAKDKELKEQLMRKYSGYISSLKHEFLKKKKKGKLPKDSREQLLNWWSVHYKWPYPSESEKASLAESTGLDQKQINNWFINQRKRHWKPSDENMSLMGQPSHSNEANSGS